MKTTSRHSTEAIKSALAGQWDKALAEICGDGPEAYNGRNGPCPKCDGRDRFRMIDNDSGGCICNQCFPGGDGFSWLRHRLDIDFQEAKRLLVEWLGMDSPQAAPQAPQRPKAEKPKLDAELSHRVLSSSFALLGG